MIRFFQIHAPRRTVLLAATEAGLIALALLAATLARSGSDLEFALWYERGLLKVGIASAVCMLCMYYYDLYESSVLRSTREALTRLVQVLGTACVILAVLYYIYPVAQLSWGTVLPGILLAGVALLAWRRVYFLLTRAALLAERAVLLGEGPLTALLLAEIERRPQLGLRVVGYLGATPSGAAVPLRSLGTIEDIVEVVARERVTRVIVSSGEARAGLRREQQLQLRAYGVVMEDASDVLDAVTTPVPLDGLSLAFLVLAPFAALAIRLESPATAYKLVFWSCLALAVYTYFLYPLFLFAVYGLAQIRRDFFYLGGRRNRRVTALRPEELPSVSFIVPAYNEQPHLARKLANLRALSYPADKWEAIFVSDGSDDGTAEVLSAVTDANIRTVALSTRGGKASALNHGVVEARNEILVFSDACTLFAPEALQCLVRHFTDPSVGVVCGALRFDQSAESRQTEGVYWNYEGVLRLMEARLGATLTASGAIYACRRKCYPHLPTSTILEDFIVPMHARQMGQDVVYDPEATARDFAALTVGDEFKRRVRLSAGSFRALIHLARIPLRGLTCWALLSHKVLRWLIPFLLIGLLAASALLRHEPFYGLMLAGQVLFYLWALAGFLLRRHLQRVRFALIGYFLVAMNAAFLVGFFRFLLGAQDFKWQRVSQEESKWQQVSP